MCGIVAVLNGPYNKSENSSSGDIEEALIQLADSFSNQDFNLEEAVLSAENLNHVLKKGVHAMVISPELLGRAVEIISHIEVELEEAHQARRRELATQKITADKESSEKKGVDSSVEFRLLQDLIFSIKWDRLKFIEAIVELATQLTKNQPTKNQPSSSQSTNNQLTSQSSMAEISDSAISALSAVQIALDGIDKLEVRGRDSAGIQILLYGGSLTEPKSYIYKVAYEIGELGYNTAQLKKKILFDVELSATLSGASDFQTTVLAHTRWASVGLISEANAHPQIYEDSAEQITAVVNGQIDNYKQLVSASDFAFPQDVTTDSRVVPALTLKNLNIKEGAKDNPPKNPENSASENSQKISSNPFEDAFEKMATQLEGSVAIAATSTKTPNLISLSLSGSGQALYVGLADGAYIVASEPYGLVAMADTYIQLENECVHLSAEYAGSLKGIKRASKGKKKTSGTETSLEVRASDLTTREISTKDIHRGEHPHFFVKEIYEAPDSILKTLDGRLIKSTTKSKSKSKPDIQLAKDFNLGQTVTERLTSSDLRRIFVTGQGTAAVAARAVADSIKSQIVNSGLPISVEPLLASELSSLVVGDKAQNKTTDMSDSLVIVISQSGTTADTNRTVELVREKGAVALCVVNRRNSDLVKRSDGVFYTSDGRDIEMSVASTKAFYSQAVAGILLGCHIADLLNVPHDPADRQALLKGLVDLPKAMESLLAKREEIAEMANRLAPSRRWWAVVGSGRDRISAQEVRIKLSELCYKSISHDSIEDKKHIDLSAEPLILVCASSLSGSIAQDMVAEVAIYCAHRAAPIIFTNATTAGALSGRDVIVLDDIDHRVAFILSALAGHLFSYEAALAIDEGAASLRKTRSIILESLAQPDFQIEELLTDERVTAQAEMFEQNLRKGEYNGHLQASTANRLSTLYRYVTGRAELETYQLDFGKTGTPTQVIDDLTTELSTAIDELTRPIDAIRHQAKTVTVGISRTDETYLDSKLVENVFGAGVPKDQLSYESLKTLAALDPVVEEIRGFIRYLIQGDNLSVLDKSGEATQIESRVESNPELLGTKHRVTTEQKVLITESRSDGRAIIIVPEVKNGVPVGLTLLHIKPFKFLPVDEAASVMTKYKGRLGILEDAVRETEPEFDVEKLGKIPIMDLLDKPIAHLADEWGKSK